MALRIIQVGMGGWGRDWATNVLPQVEEVEPVGCVDPDPATREAVQAALGVPASRCFSSLDAALEAVDVDAVLVTTPLPAHIPVAVAALEAGKHALVEKPFAPSLAEARRAVEIAEARDRVLMVSQNYRFFPAPRVVAELVRSGELGPAGPVHVDFRRPVTARSGSRRHFTLEHPLLADMAIHHFDLMRMVLGQEPRRVFCHAWNPPWSPFTGDAAAAAIVTFDGGAVVSWRGSWVSPGPRTAWAGEWRMECAQGEIAWTSRDEMNGVSADRVTIRPLDGPVREIELPVLRRYGRAGVLTAFAAAVNAGVEPETSGRANLGSLALVGAAVAAAAIGQTVSVPEEAGEPAAH